jgi:hypothetical protein
MQWALAPVEFQLGYNLPMRRMKTVMLAESLSVHRARMQTLGLLAAVCFLLLWLTVPAAAQAGKRLILKDGSWQEVMKYEVSGDRTRYFSTPRREWEDVPRDLVDWKATEEWNARPMQLPPEDEDGPESEVETAAPGLQLPDSGGVFILDTLSGQPSLVELIQVPGVLNHGNAGIFHSGVSSKATFNQHLELRGTHARTQAHVLLPHIFVKIAESDHTRQISTSERFRIVRLEPNKGFRIVASVDVSVIGKQRDTQEFVPVRVESFSEGWLKVVPVEDLSPGEYALVEMLDHSQFNTYAWDFGIAPPAPGALNLPKADSEAHGEPDTFSPELKPREK